MNKINDDVQYLKHNSLFCQVMGKFMTIKILLQFSLIVTE